MLLLEVTLLIKVHVVKIMVFPVVLYGSESWTIKESWALRNGCSWTVVLEKTFESPLESKEIKPVKPKGNQPWVFTEKADTEAEAPILWPPDSKSWLIGKDPDAGKDWGQEEKGTTEDEMVGWYHWLMDMSLSKLWEMVKKGSLVCYTVHGVTKSWTWLIDWTELNFG